MKVQSQANGPATVLTAHGPLVADDTGDLRGALQAARSTGVKRVVIDLSDVPYLDSAGIELLLEFADASLSPHQRPKLAALSETCLEALELPDVLPRLEVFDTVENALRSCAR